MIQDYFKNIEIDWKQNKDKKNLRLQIIFLKKFNKSFRDEVNTKLYNKSN